MNIVVKAVVTTVVAGISLASSYWLYKKAIDKTNGPKAVPAS